LSTSATPTATPTKTTANFLADISSFANASGGDIVIGMDAKTGIPIGLRPLSIDADSETLRLESIARSGFQPRIFGLDMRSIQIGVAGNVIVIRIPRSYNQPHRIVRQGSGQHRFYARSSAGKYEPNVDELRLLFARAPQLSERIRDFRFDRIAKVTANDTPVRLLNGHALIVHVVPFSAFDTRMALPLDPHQRLYSAFPPIGSSQTINFWVNVDGLLTLSNAEVNAKAHRAYAQVFHNGIVESVVSSFVLGECTDEDPFRLTSLRTEASIVQSSYTFLQGLMALGCSPPFALLVSLIGVKGVPYSFTTAYSGFRFEDEAGTLDRDQFHFSESDNRRPSVRSLRIREIAASAA
jgi:hypothetical protein